MLHPHRKKLITVSIVIITLAAFFYAGSQLAIRRIQKETGQILRQLQEEENKTPSLSNYADAFICSDDNVCQEEDKVQQDQNEKSTSQINNNSGETGQEKPDYTEGEKPKKKIPEEHSDKDDLQKDDPPKKHALFGYMPVEDQQYVLSISNRFTISEIKNIYDAYHQGGEEWIEARIYVRENVSDEEIERCRILYEKYIEPLD